MSENAPKPKTHPLSWVALVAGIGIGVAVSQGARPQLGWLGAMLAGMVVSVAVGFVGFWIVSKLVKPKA